MLVQQGIDPVDAEHERRRQAVDLAFEAYAETFVELYLKKRWKDAGLGAGVLRRHVVPVLGRKPLPKIKPSDLNPVWDATSDRPATARLVHATLRKLFRWAVSRGDLERSPLASTEPPPPLPARDRVLADDEIARIWRGCGELGYPFANLIRLLMVTGQRRDEVASMNWRELSRVEAIWILPAIRSKNKKPHLVPLSGLAMSLIDNVAGGENWPKEGLVFSTTGTTAASGFSKVKRRLDDYLGSGSQDHREVEKWRLHDIRRTVATGLQRLGVRFEVTEAVLNHVSGSRGGVAGVYQRHDWRDEKSDALGKWAAYLKNLEAGV